MGALDAIVRQSACVAIRSESGNAFTGIQADKAQMHWEPVLRVEEPRHSGRNGRRSGRQCQRNVAGVIVLQGRWGFSGEERHL